MGEAVFYLAAKYDSEERSGKAEEVIANVARGAAFLNKVFQRIRYEKKASPKERVRLMNLLAESLERDHEERMCVAEKLRTSVDIEVYLEERKEIGDFPDLSDFLPDNPPADDLGLNWVTDTLPDMTFDFVLTKSGPKVLLSDYVWHHTDWGPLAGKIRSLTEPKRIEWVSDEYVSVGDLLLELLDFEEVKL